LCAGIEKFAGRWKTASWLAWWAMSGMDWMPDEPVPMTATPLAREVSALVRPATGDVDPAGETAGAFDVG